jgi:hypothetical protein
MCIELYVSHVYYHKIVTDLEQDGFALESARLMVPAPGDVQSSSYIIPGQQQDSIAPSCR